MWIIRQSYQDKITLTKTTNKNNDNADYEGILKHSKSVYALEIKIKIFTMLMWMVRSPPPRQTHPLADSPP